MSLDMRNIERLPSGNFRVRFEYRGESVGGVVATHEEAVDLRDDLKRKIIDGSLAPTKGCTARDRGPQFLGSRLGNRSSDDDTGRWNNHIANAPWARKAIPSVTRADGNAWLKSLKRKRVCFDPEKHGQRENKFLAWQTRKHCLNLARSFFAWAIDEECYGITLNPFVGLKVAKDDGDEDEGYQDGWYLDLDEQPTFFGTWDRRDIGLDEGDRMEKWIAMFAMGSGLRKGETWCLHLSDVHVDEREPKPRVEVRFGSWDNLKKRYKAPKGRKGEKKKRTVYLYGFALEAARAWLKLLPIYAPRNPLGLMFPTERGARRTGVPRSWKKVTDAFGVIPRIGRKVWWHLLRHTCASSLVSGWWGMRWYLEDVREVLGHTDVRTTQMYAHLAPSALQATTLRAQAAFTLHASLHGSRPGVRSVGILWHARTDSNHRHPASKAAEIHANSERFAPRGDAVEAICHVLELVADGKLDLPHPTIEGLEKALDLALQTHASHDTRLA